MDSNNNSVKVFDNSFRIFILIFLVLIGLICALPFWLTSEACSPRFNFTKTGEIGDTIGGTMGPFIAIAAALLTFIAFWVQFKANKQQSLQFEKQANDVTIERFENKFYEMLGIQRANLNEIKINDDAKARKAIILMFYEFRFCYANIKKHIEEYNQQELGFDSKDESVIIDIAYHLFFMGIGNNSDKLTIASLNEKCEQEFILKTIRYLEDIKEKYDAGNKTFTVKLKDNSNKLEYTAYYKPFDGHISRLGHYFRHLYQTVKLISEQDDKIINENKKCEYAKTLRAQLSDHEQLLLYYNINSSLGRAWINKKENFITRFRMIKNIPLPLADFGILPKDKFANAIEHWKKKGKYFFEWDERTIH